MAVIENKKEQVFILWKWVEECGACVCVCVCVWGGGGGGHYFFNTIRTMCLQKCVYFIDLYKIYSHIREIYKSYNSHPVSAQMEPTHRPLEIWHLHNQTFNIVQIKPDRPFQRN